MLADLLQVDSLIEAARIAAKNLVPGVGDEISPSMRRTVYEAAGHRCRACGATENLSVDHIVPTHFGGPTILSNLQCLCKPCNSSKGARLDWRGRQA